ncbi:MAG TPA: HTTM domain-containing protein [Longimicrobiales bacterium]|nr:HTTM domain-containing protein [Longimicrobiales bacterium]
MVEAERPVREAVDERPLPVFACLWAIATLFHQAAWPARHVGAPMFLLTLAAVCVLLRPRSLRLFLGFLLLQVAVTVHQLPHGTSNHGLLTGFVAATMLLAWLGLAVRQRSPRVTRGELFAAFAPVARVELVILYSYAVLHKLNHDFLSPTTSCAAEHLGRLTAVLPGVSSGPWLSYGAIYGTLIIEAAIPVLLVIRSTRLLGVALGTAFHLALVFDLRWSFYDFSAFVYALYFLFIPDLVLRGLETAGADGGRAARWLHRLRAPRFRAALRGALLVLAAGVVLAASYHLGTGRGPGDHPVVHDLIRHLPRVALLAYAVIAFAVIATIRRRGPRLDDGYVATLRPRTLAAVMVPVVFLNGLAPYVGLKTEKAYSMFSNLATEGGRTNHLFMPVRFRVAGYQEDLVQVLESSLPALQRLADRDQLLPFFEFRHIAGQASGHYVTYRRGGQTYVLRDVSDSPELMTPASWLERKALQFRPVSRRDGATPCTH